MLVILLNCVTLGMFHPCEDINCDSERCKILQVRPIFLLDHISGPNNYVVTAVCYNSECRPSLFSTSSWLNCYRRTLLLHLNLSIAVNKSSSLISEVPHQMLVSQEILKTLPHSAQHMCAPSSLVKLTPLK